MRIAERAGIAVTPALRAAYEGLDPGAPSDYRALASLLAASWLARPRPRLVGLSGGQGTGKSTLARLLEPACAAFGLRAAVLALDDFYRTRSERRSLAGTIHPLFETRGPPGTHDVAGLRSALASLTGTRSTEVPCFDKGRDDRVGMRRLVGPFDVVVLEGWCVGARPETTAALADPVNALERDEDPLGRWRAHANAALATEYAELFAMLSELVFLKAPDLGSIRRWRLEQEAERPAGSRMDAEKVERFVAHFERTTRAMLVDLPARADWTIELAPDHSIAEIVRRRSSRAAG